MFIFGDLIKEHVRGYFSPKRIRKDIKRVALNMTLPYRDECQNHHKINYNF
jgi:hypothetical protein